MKNLRISQLSRRIGTPISLILFLLLQVMGNKGYGQVATQPPSPDTNHHSFCKVIGGGTGGVPIPPNYSQTAIQNCGAFEIYYDDINVGGFPSGFNDPIVGATRRNTLCAVLTYLQNVLDFSQVPAADPIRLRIQQTYIPITFPAPLFPANPWWNNGEMASSEIYLP